MKIILIIWLVLLTTVTGYMAYLLDYNAKINNEKWASYLLREKENVDNFYYLKSLCSKNKNRN